MTTTHAPQKKPFTRLFFFNLRRFRRLGRRRGTFDNRRRGRRSIRRRLFRRR